MRLGHSAGVSPTGRRQRVVKSQGWDQTALAGFQPKSQVPFTILCNSAHIKVKIACMWTALSPGQITDTVLGAAGGSPPLPPTLPPGRLCPSLA